VLVCLPFEAAAGAAGAAVRAGSGALSGTRFTCSATHRCGRLGVGGKVDPGGPGRPLAMEAVHIAGRSSRPGARTLRSR